MTTTMIHPFEKAGLGIAPFRFIGMCEKSGPIMLPDGSQVGAQGFTRGISGRKADRRKSMQA